MPSIINSDNGVVSGSAGLKTTGASDGITAFQQSGTESMRITAAGNVGIGTNSPGQKLAVAGTVESTSGGFKFPDGTTQATAAGSAFPAGTLMLFQQTAAPTGWTKQTTHNNKALRVVSGAASSGGSVAFTTAFANGSTGATTLATSQIPSHLHTYAGNSNPQSPGSPNYPDFTWSSAGTVSNRNTGNEGGGGSHNHSLTLDVQYVDLIIASKD